MTWSQPGSRSRSSTTVRPGRSSWRKSGDIAPLDQDVVMLDTGDVAIQRLAKQAAALEIGRIAGGDDGRAQTPVCRGCRDFEGGCRVLHHARPKNFCRSTRARNSGLPTT